MTKTNKNSKARKAKKYVTRGHVTNRYKYRKSRSKLQARKKLSAKKLVQKGGVVNSNLQTYFQGVNQQVNKYDVKLMFIYALMNLAITPEQRAEIIKLLKMQSFGRKPDNWNNSRNGIWKDKLVAIFGFIKSILELDITGIVSLSARENIPNWKIWLSQQERMGLSLPSSLIDSSVLNRIAYYFDDSGVLTREKDFIAFIYSYITKLPMGYSLQGSTLQNNTEHQVYGSAAQYADLWKSNKYPAPPLPPPRLSSRDTESGAAAAANPAPFMSYMERQGMIPETPTPSGNRLTHFWFTNWPDHGVPENHIDYCNFINMIYDDMVMNKGRTLIHCSAGVGRTGVVYVSLYLLIELNKRKQQSKPKIQLPLSQPQPWLNEKYIYDIIMMARQFRMQLVQGNTQFEFIFKCFGIPYTGTYSVEQNLIAPGKTSYNAQLPDNKPKNRYGNILPYDDNLVEIDRTSNNPNGYINASFAPCPPAKFACPDFILAQCPFNNEKEKINVIPDFLNMIKKYEVRRIIMVTKLTEQKSEKTTSKCDDYLGFSNDKEMQIYDFYKYSPSIMPFGGQITEYTYPPYSNSASRSNTPTSSSA